MPDFCQRALGCNQNGFQPAFYHPIRIELRKLQHAGCCHLNGFSGHKADEFTFFDFNAPLGGQTCDFEVDYVDGRLFEVRQVHGYLNEPARR